MLKTEFVPVALDQAYQRRQQDAEGEFYRKIAGQGPRNDFNDTTQGRYIATADGKLLAFNNNRGPERVKRLMKEALATRADKKAKPIDAGAPDPRWGYGPPEDGLVVRVRAKVLGGYEETTDPWRKMFQSALSRDNLWISQSEHASIARGEIPDVVARRIARFHLVDNTRGEPPMWNDDEIRSLKLSLADGRLTGTFHLETNNGDRGFQGEVLGFVETDGTRVTRFDLVATGTFWGEGAYTRGAPQGKFPLAVAFTLADGEDVADRVPPQASRGWLRGYME